MKRSAAVFGATPQFVTWTILQNCALRDLVEDNIPQSTFRQLRSLQAVALAKTEGRFLDGICFHPSVDQLPEDAFGEALGFHEDEVFAVYGGNAFVESCCRRCPANIHLTRSDEESVDRAAGCFGWMAGDLHWDTTKRLQTPAHDLVQLVDNALVEMREDSDVSQPGNWNQLWLPGKFHDEALPFMAKVFSKVMSDCQIREHEQPLQLTRISMAVAKCVEHDMTLLAHLHPAGFSDGQSWTISSHCSNCKSAAIEGRSSCERCGSESAPVPVRKQKVLGLRPYLKLKHILGETVARERVLSYRKHRRNSQT